MKCHSPGLECQAVMHCLALLPELKKQLEAKTEIISKKDTVISNQNARINVLEEMLRLNKVERFGASSEKESPQVNFFNEAELLGDDADNDEQSDGDDSASTDEKPTKKRGKRKKLNADIPRVQERLLLSDSSAKTPSTPSLSPSRRSSISRLPRCK